MSALDTVFWAPVLLLLTGVGGALAVLIHYLADDVPGDPMPVMRAPWAEVADAVVFFGCALLVVVGLTAGWPA